MNRSTLARCTIVLCTVSVFLFFSAFPGKSLTEPPQPPSSKLSTITVPPGYVVELVAGPPLVEHPMLACFDERGRLFVAESAGRNFRAADLLKDPADQIRVLEDTDGDGKFDKSTVFADKMSFPMGVLWHEGALYTASPPSLWKLEDADGDGVADKRQELVTRFGFTGNAADIHGPFLSPAGRIYWADGRHGHEIKRSDGRLLKGKAARIFRCRPDGTEVEVVCGGGMDNPVEVAFTPEGEAFATVDILLTKPRIDAIIHCIEGGVFPWNEVYKEFKCTGELLPAVSQLGWVAPAGLMRYRGHALGEALHNNLFSAQFNRHRIQRHVLRRDGATFSATNEDFLVSSDKDFHPTDVLEDADGSLLVIDTGGWFRIGCPTSQIAKPDIKGAIYRVRRKDAPVVKDPRGLALKWNERTPGELTTLLDDARVAVRDRAVQTLARQGNKAMPALLKQLQDSKSVRARRNTVWALARMESPAAREHVRTALQDTDVSVRLAAVHTLGLQRDGAALASLNKLVAGDNSPAVRREAATALGRLHKADAIPFLFAGLRSGGDRFLEHALLFALIEINDRQGTLEGLTDASPVVRRGALIALDQMPDGNLTQELVTPLLNTTDPALQKTALAIISSRPGWGKNVLGLLKNWLGQETLDDQRKDSLQGALLAFAEDADVQKLVAMSLRDDKAPLTSRLLLLEIMARAPLEKLPTTWVAEIGRALQHPEQRVVRQALVVIEATRLDSFDRSLLSLAQDRAKPADMRLAALTATAPRLSGLAEDLFELLLSRLDQETAPIERLAAARTLASAGKALKKPQLLALGKVVGKAGPLELPHLLAAYEGNKDRQVGLMLAEAVGLSPALSSLSPEAIVRTFRTYPAEVKEKSAALVKRLTATMAKQQARLKELEPALSGGNAQRGRDVFFGTKAACAACHTVNREGGRIGPDLTTIGAIRPGRDLLESVVFPSASFARGYESFVVTTRKGHLHTGILGRETAEAIYLITPERAEVRLLRSTIESLEPAPVSIMPQGLDMQLTDEELRDLLGFLQSLR